MPKTELTQNNPPLTHPWVPRPHQNDALDAFKGGLRRQIHIWHRRAGKDDFGLNLGRIESQRKLGNYWHLFPLQTQAKKAIWEGLDGEGRRIIDHIFPEELREATLQAEMMIKFKNGSTWQMAGSDRYKTCVTRRTRSWRMPRRLMTCGRLAARQTALQRQIDATDRRIDRLVYQLYGLSDDEIRIVEEATGS